MNRRQFVHWAGLAIPSSLAVLAVACQPSTPGPGGQLAAPTATGPNPQAKPTQPAAQTSASAPSGAQPRVSKIQWASAVKSKEDMKFIQAAIDGYKAQYGTDVGFTTLTLDSFTTVVNTIKAGTSFDLASGVLATTTYLANLDYLTPVDAIIEGLGGPKAFVPSTLYPVNGHYYAVPYDALTTMQYWRTDWLADVDESMPKTWDDLKRVLAKWKAKGHGGWSFPMTPGAISNTDATDILWSAGVNILDKEGNVVLDQGNNATLAAQCLDFIRECKPYIADNMVSADYAAVTNSFYTGTAGLAPYPGRIAQKIVAAYPDMVSKFGVSGFPSPDGKQPQGATLEIDNYFIPKGAQGAVEAAEFLTFMLSKYFTQLILADPVQRQPPLVATYQDPAWVSDATQSAVQSVINTQKDMLSGNGYTLSGVNNQPSGPTTLSSVIFSNNVIGNMYQDVFVNGMAAKDAATKAADACRALARGLK